MSEQKLTTRRDILAYGGAGLVAAGTGLIGSAGPAAAQQVKYRPEQLLAKTALPDIWVGKADAPVSIIEYAALTCSHCGAFHNGTYKELKAKYVDTGKVRIALREFPLHVLGIAGFMLARCEGPERRTAIVDLLFSKQQEWLSSKKPFDTLVKMSKQAGISQENFEKCLKNKELYGKVEAMRTDASNKFKVKSTPTFFVNGVMVVGGRSLTEFENVLKPMLK